VIITTANLLHYLLAKGLLNVESVVDGDFAVVDVSGRNRNLKVIRKHSPGYFVKQVRHWDAQKIAMLQCEAACYWLAHNDPDFAALAPLIPEFHYFDFERQILITGLIRNGEDLWENFRRCGQISAGVAGQLGNLIGTYHSKVGQGPNETSSGAIFPRQIPWILSAERRNSHPFKELSPATKDLFDSVEGSSELCAALDQLRKDWPISVLMHGDMRLENCIISQENHGESTLRIVDWELADIGDPNWDVGSLLQSFLCPGIMSLPESESPLSLEELAAKNSLNWWQPAIVAFWDNYIAAVRVDDEQLSDLAERCISYCAARMIQSSYEYMQFSPQLSRKALQLLGVSRDIFAGPSAAARLFFELKDH
jgi:hypothetical protein